MEGYKYGFDGKENDNEVKEEGNQQDYGMRVYDPRLGKFLSVDPLQARYPNLTTYQFASNSPIAYIDLDGLEKYHYALTLSEQGNVIIKLTSIEHFSEWQWKPKTGGTALGFQLWEKVEDPRQEHIVECSFSDYLVIGGAAEPTTTTLTATFNSQEGAQSATMSDFEGAEKRMEFSKGLMAGIDMPGIPRGRVRLTPGGISDKQGVAAHSGSSAPDGLGTRRSDYSNFGSESLDMPGMRETKIEFGRVRAATHRDNWAGGSLKAALAKFVPDAVKIKEMGKTMFKGKDFTIIYDNGGDYFRIKNNSAPGTHVFTDLTGKIPNNKIVNGKQKGMNNGEYQAATHFYNTDK